MFNSQNTYYGNYIGYAFDVDDPKRLGRILVQVPLLSQDPVTGEIPPTGWAIPIGVGGKHSSSIALPEKGDLVIVSFEQGDFSKPFWQHGPPSNYKTKDGLYNSQPSHARDLYDEADVTERGGDVPTTKNNSSFDKVKQIRNEAGYIELLGDDGSEIITINHKSGTRIQIQPDGTIHILAQGNVIDKTSGSKKEIVLGKSDVAVKGKRVEKYDTGRSVSDLGKLEYSNNTTLEATVKSIILNLIGKDSGYNNGSISVNAGNVNIESLSTKIKSNSGISLTSGATNSIIGVDSVKVQSILDNIYISTGASSPEQLINVLTPLLPVLQTPGSIIQVSQVVPGVFGVSCVGPLGTYFTGTAALGVPPTPLVKSDILIPLGFLLTDIIAFATSVGGSNPAASAAATKLVTSASAMISGSAAYPTRTVFGA